MPRIDNAFGRTPDDFNRHVDTTLDRIVEGEQMKMKHKTVGGIWIFALVLVLLMGTALALTTGLGVLDFKQPVDDRMQEVQEMVVDLTEVPAVETEHVRYQVKDAIWDGINVMLTIAADALEPDTYMLSPDIEENVVGMGMEKTYGQMAKEQGKKIMHAQAPVVYINGERGSITSIQSRYDGDTLYWFIAPAGIDTSAASLQIECEFWDAPLHQTTYVEEDDGTQSIIPEYGDSSEERLSFEIDTKASNIEKLRFEGPFPLEYVDVDWIEIIRSPLNTYTRVQYTVHDTLTEAGREAVFFLNFMLMQSAEDTQVAHGGTGNTMAVGMERVPENLEGVTMLQEVAWPVIEAFPDTLYMRAWSAIPQTFDKAIVLDVGEAITGG